MTTSTGKKIIVIPARMESNRLPGKPMASIAGTPLIRWTYDRAKKTIADYVIVATPDREIGRYCQQNGMLWRPTRGDHPDGTHRIEEVIRHFKEGVEVDVVVNWQCDEPLIVVKAVNLLMEQVGHGSDGIATLASCSQDIEQITNLNVTKVVVSNGRAMWFSRAEIGGAMLHCGVYAFRPRVLARLAQLQPSALSLAESLEQLAWIEAGFRIGVIETQEFPLSINTPEDLERFKQMVETCN